MSGRLSRRAALTGAGALVPAVLASHCAAPALAEASPDAGLIRLCAEFDGLEREHQRLSAIEQPTDESEEETRRAQEPLEERQEHLLDKICTTPATTTDGYLARARTLALWNPEHLKLKPSAYWDERMIAALLQDLLLGDRPFLDRLKVEAAARRARSDAAVAAMEARQAAEEAKRAARPPPPRPGTPESREAVARQFVKASLKGWREARAELRAAQATDLARLVLGVTV